jgi:hypothetical protein
MPLFFYKIESSELLLNQMHIRTDTQAQTTSSSHNLMFENMMLMFLMSLTTAIVGAIINRMTSFRIGDMKSIVEAVKRLFAPPLNSIIIDDTATMAAIGASWNKDMGTEHNEELINAIKAYLIENNAYSTESKCTLAAGNSNMQSNFVDRMLARDIQLLPLQRVERDGFIFTTTHEVKRGEGKSQTVYKLSMKIESALSQEHIRRFLENCYREYVQSRYGIAFVPSLYKQIPYKEGLRFKKYSIDSKMVFSDIFFPEKEKIIELADKLREGKLTKLSLLLHGTPGCGKTSIIKALANYLRYSVIVLKLSFMVNDSSIDDAFNVPVLMYRQYNDESYGSSKDDVPRDKRIYILEDVDAESEIVKSRESKDNEPSPVPPPPPMVMPVPLTDGEPKEKTKTRSVDDIYSKMMSYWVKEEITLSGFLNAIDGIIDLKGVLIMTTNYPEKLDPALIRPGRITYSLKLREMTAEDADRLSAKHFGEPVGNVIGGMITPAQMDAFCQTATSITELRELVDQFQKNKQVYT